MPSKTNSPQARQKNKRGPRLSKVEWLTRATRLLEEHGPAAMKLDSLTNHLGVTIGSFYHHFTDHGTFLEELTDKYIEDYTYIVQERILAMDLDPRELLIAAMKTIIENNLGGLDIHFRGLSYSYPQIEKKIEEMDRFRTGFISGLYKAMGYSGKQLQMRVHTFVVLHSMEHTVNTGLRPGDRSKLMDERIKLLID